MSFHITVSGASADAVRTAAPTPVKDLVASAITALHPEIVLLREQLHAAGITYNVLAGMGGSSLAPEVITQTAGVKLTVLDSSAPGQVLAALNDRLASTALVVSPKSGSTVVTETDSARRVFRVASKNGINPALLT